MLFLPPYAPEYNPDEYLNHALKLFVHTGDLLYTERDIYHKIHSFMRRLQHNPLRVTPFFLHPHISYLSAVEKYNLERGLCQPRIIPENAANFLVCILRAVQPPNIPPVKPQHQKHPHNKAFRWMWLTIVLSFGFYIPVVLWADTIPLIGMLMIPKTCAYVWTVLIGYFAMKQECR